MKQYLEDPTINAELKKMSRKKRKESLKFLEQYNNNNILKIEK